MKQDYCKSISDTEDGLFVVLNNPWNKLITCNISENQKEWQNYLKLKISIFCLLFQHAVQQECNATKKIILHEANDQASVLVKLCFFSLGQLYWKSEVLKKTQKQ